MNFVKKAVRLIVLVVILLLASVGAGFGAVIMPAYRRNDSFASPIEMVDQKDEEMEEKDKG